MAKIIFLDVDGPLIPLKNHINGNRQRDSNGFFIWDSYCVDQYNIITDKHDAKIVFNSAHNASGSSIMKRHASLNGLNNIHPTVCTNFAAVMNGRFLFTSEDRYIAIQKWINDYKALYNDIHWVVVDDLPVHLPKQVLVNLNTGPTANCFTKLDYMLSGI